MQYNLGFCIPMGLSLGTCVGIMLFPIIGNLAQSMVFGSSLGLVLGIVAWAVMSSRENS